MVLVSNAPVAAGSRGGRRMIRGPTTSPGPSRLGRFFLNFPGSLFVFAFGFQLGIHTEFPGDLLELTRRLVKIALRLVLRAGFHAFPPVGFALTDGTLAPVIPVIKLLAGTALPFSFFPAATVWNIIS
jgi:hypothetical protein